MSMPIPQAVGGNRLIWDELPDSFRGVLEAAVGSPVSRAVSKDGGFSPGLASVLTLADGTTVFVKAADVARSEFTVDAIRRETRVLAALPDDAPAPRLRWSFDDGEWAALVTEAVAGCNPAQPWVPEELQRFLAAATVLAERLTPSPIQADPIEHDEDDFHGWTKLASDTASAASLEPQVRPYVDRLALIEQPWAAATAGTALLHGDLRADNLMLTDDGFVMVDWPEACIGAPWLDLVFSLPSVAMQGGGDPPQLWAGHPLSHGVDTDAINTVVAAMAGFFIYRSLQPVPPLLPTLRMFQKAQGMIAFDWLSHRMGWR